MSFRSFQKNRATGDDDPTWKAPAAGNGAVEQDFIRSLTRTAAEGEQEAADARAANIHETVRMPGTEPPPGRGGPPVAAARTTRR